jgi:hypothetical protein
MSPTDPLTLPEEILLLALHDEKGTTGIESMYQYAIGGAILAELLMRNRLRLADDKKKTVQLVDPKPIGDPLLDAGLTRLIQAKKPAAAQTWVSRFAGTKRLKHLAAQRLCDRGILEADERKILLLFSQQIYPEINPEPERKVLEGLRQAIFTETDNLDPHTVVLVSLAHTAGLLPAVFDKKDLKARKDRIERIVNGDALGRATKEAIEAVQAAVMVACILPAITAATVTN